MGQALPTLPTGGDVLEVEPDRLTQKSRPIAGFSLQENVLRGNLKRLVEHQIYPLGVLAAAVVEAEPGLAVLY